MLKLNDVLILTKSSFDNNSVVFPNEEGYLFLNQYRYIITLELSYFSYDIRIANETCNRI